MQKLKLKFGSFNYTYKNLSCISGDKYKESISVFNIFMVISSKNNVLLCPSFIIIKTVLKFNQMK